MRSQTLHRQVEPLLFLLPAGILIISLSIYPIAACFGYSFLNYRIGGSEISIVGLDNYREAIDDQYFSMTLVITFKFLMPYVAMSLVIAFGIALILNEQFKGRRICRTLFLIPWAISPVANSLMWGWIFNAGYGIVNKFLVITGLTDRHVMWLGTPDLAMLVVILATVWKDVPFVALVLLGGLQGVSQELYDAAKVDGTSVFQRFRHVTFPGVRSIFITLLILYTIWGLRYFDIFYVLTKGEPLETTLVYILYVFRQLMQYFNVGYCSALSFMLTLISAAFAIMYFKFLYKEQ